MVDIEFYGEFANTPVNKEWVTSELTILLNTLESRYGQQPILYATKSVYDFYLADTVFAEYPLWM